MSVGESEFLSVENVHKIKIAVAGVGCSVGLPRKWLFFAMLTVYSSPGAKVYGVVHEWCTYARH